LKSEGARRVCVELGRIARDRFRSADLALPADERRNMRPALLMRGIYEPYLDRLEARGFRLDLPRVRFGPIRKMCLLLGALAASR